MTPLVNWAKVAISRLTHKKLTVSIGKIKAAWNQIENTSRQHDIHMPKDDASLKKFDEKHGKRHNKAKTRAQYKRSIDNEAIIEFALSDEGGNRIAKNKTRRQKR